MDILINRQSQPILQISLNSSTITRNKNRNLFNGKIRTPLALNSIAVKNSVKLLRSVKICILVTNIYIMVYIRYEGSLSADLK